MPPPTIATLFIAELYRSKNEMISPISSRFFASFLGRLIAAERAAGDVDLALLADDDVERLFVMARLRPVQHQLVIDQAALRCRAFSASATA